MVEALVSKALGGGKSGKKPKEKATGAPKAKKKAKASNFYI